MTEISSKAAGKLENKKKFNDIELNTDFDLNIGEALFRTHDGLYCPDQIQTVYQVWIWKHQYLQ